jgi:hypothetical protein
MPKIEADLFCREPSGGQVREEKVRRGRGKRALGDTAWGWVIM